MHVNTSFFITCPLRGGRCSKGQNEPGCVGDDGKKEKTGGLSSRFSLPSITNALNFSSPQPPKEAFAEEIMHCKLLITVEFFGVGLIASHSLGMSPREQTSTSRELPDC